VAGAVALEAAAEAAKTCIQVLGGIGFTWEHDAHLYLRRAIALRQLLGPAARWRTAAARHALTGSRRTLAVALDGPGTAELRDDLRAVLAGLPDDERQRRRAIADAGLAQPHWPAPWGRDAGPQEQLLIEQEMAAAGIERPDLVIGGWVLPTIIGYGTPQQQERFVRPTLYGDVVWCQLFSEPGAGSDLAALQTKATRTDGGWLLSGQKVWTSVAHKADWGLCLARTDPSAPKHEGITCFVVDMKAEGVDIRPLRELTGRAMFNEVFLSDVFVPDDQVIGGLGEGWRAGRTTLANERVAMSSGSTMGAGVEGVLGALAAGGDPGEAALERAGALVCEGQVLAVLGLRTTLRKLGGLEPGAGSSVRKLVGMHHAQSCAEHLLELQGPAGATLEGSAGRIGSGFLQSRCLTIAGGTTEVQRNVVAERILGLPRDDVR
jgi:3-oxochol-4-en-24-oyl-CoA dehydrogenase